MTKMMPVSAWQFAIFMVLVAGVVAVSTSPALAAGTINLSPITNILTGIATTLTGPLGKAMATLAVIGIGGGLTVPLWAHERRPDGLLAMVLNSPWFDMQGSAWLRSPAAKVAIERLGTRRPMQAIPRKISGVYGRSLHREHGGEWDYDLELKLTPGPPVRVGWLRAVLQGQRKVAGGLGIDAPVLVLASARTSFARRWSEDLRGVDSVLDVEQIAARIADAGPAR